MDIEVIRSLNIAARSGCRVFHRGGHVIREARPRQPYGTSLHTRARLTHIPAKVFIAWRGGEVIGQMARWRCGGSSRAFGLTAEPLYALCVVCLSCLRPSARIVSLSILVSAS